MESLGLTLEKLNNLQELILNFAFTKISDKAIENFS